MYQRSKNFKNEKGNLIKLLLEHELFQEELIWRSDKDFFQNYLDFLHFNGGKNIEIDFGNEDFN